MAALLLIPIFSFVVLIILIRLLFITITVVNVSMEPTLENGDRLLGIRPWPHNWLRKGQIVIIHPIERTQDDCKTLFVKRVVGLPGETIVTRILDLDETRKVIYRDRYDEYGNRTCIIPQKNFFVLGDNVKSCDSRDWGPISLNHLVGIAFLRLPGKAKVISEIIPSNKTLMDMHTVILDRFNHEDS